MIFDRYVVKSNVTDDDEKREWVLLKPYVYEDNKRGTRSLRYKQTFEKNEQEAIVKAVSCLQVSFRAKPYKNYLQVILEWFKDKHLIVANSYLKKLHDLMIDEFQRTSLEYIGLTKYDEKRQGTNVHQYLFNFLDYLYWWMKITDCSMDWNSIDSGQIKAINIELEQIKKIDFRFLNRNSIEHHYPQKRQEEQKDEDVTNFDLNCLGNLVLISKSANSRLSDKNPKDKAALYSEKTDLPPTRQIIYNITRNVGWGKDQIISHFNCIECILKYRENILNYGKDNMK